MPSRIEKSLKNAKVNVMFYIVATTLSFFSRKIFLDHLGADFLGLSGTLGIILNMMNITELGIGTAIGMSLYQPLFKDNRGTINAIISVFGYLYSKIGLIIASTPTDGIQCLFRTGDIYHLHCHRQIQNQTFGRTIFQMV